MQLHVRLHGSDEEREGEGGQAADAAGAGGLRDVGVGEVHGGGVRGHHEDAGGEPVPDAAAVVARGDGVGEFRPGGGGADDGAGVAAPADRVRVSAAVRGVVGDGREAGEAVHRPRVRAAAAGPVRQRGPAGAGVPEDDPAPDIREVHGAPAVHPEGDQQHLLPVHLRDGEAQRDRGAAGDSGVDHQRVRAAAEGGAQDVSGAGADPAAQAEVRVDVPPAAVVLHNPVRGEGLQAGGRGDPGAAAVLAGDEQPEGGAVSGGAGGGAGGDAERGVPAVHGAAVSADRAVSEQFAFPGRVVWWWGGGTV